MENKDIKPPYYAVIFTSTLNEFSEDYEIMAEQMERVAKFQKGFLGMDAARNDKGITVSYWEDEESIKNWKQHSEHLIAQTIGKDKWYASYRVRVARVVRDYWFERD